MHASRTVEFEDCIKQTVGLAIIGLRNKLFTLGLLGTQTQ
jgi:hypothetical protein